MKSFFNRHPYALASFFLSGCLALLSFLPSILQNGVFLARNDFLNQQIPFILQSKRLLLEHGLYQWDWTSFLGADFLTSYAFYNLGSPFFWILLPLPDSAMLWGIGGAALLKHAVAGLGSYLFFCLFIRDKRLALMGSLLYVFSGFTIVNIDFNHFTDVIALFPFWLRQVEKTVRGEGRILPLALWTLLNILTNYYFAAGSLIFIATYLFFRKVRGVALVRTLTGLALGILLASFWLVPVALAMLESPRITEHNLLLRLFKPIYPTNYLERLRVFLMPIESSIAHPYFPKTYSWKSTALFLPVMGSAFAWLYLRLYSREWLARFILFLLAASIIPPLTGIFSLGTNPDYTRWWFALVLMLTLATLHVLERAHDTLPEAASHVAKRFLQLALILSLPALVFRYFFETGTIKFSGALGRYLDFAYGVSILGTPGLAWLSLTLTFVNYAILFYLFRLYRKQRNFPVGQAFIGIAFCAVLNYGSVIWWNNNALYHSGDIADPGQAYYQRVFVGEPPHARPAGTMNSRIDHVPTVENFGTLVNKPAIQAFNSVRGRYLSEFVEKVYKGAAQSPAARPPATDTALRALLSVSQLQRFDAANPDSLEPFPYRLPMGFAYRFGQNYSNFDYDTSAHLSEQLLAVLVLNSTESPLTQYGLQAPPENLHSMPWKDHVAALRQDSCQKFEGDDQGFSATCAFPSQRMVFFSVPWSPGWKARLDGVPIDIHRAQIAFMAVNLPAGQHTLRFDYTTPGAKWGLLISGLTLLLCALVRRMDKMTFKGHF